MQRRDPLARIVVGGNSAKSEDDSSSEGSGSMGKIAYVPGAKAESDGTGWVPRFGVSAERWSIDPSVEEPEVLYTDLEFFFRDPDLLCEDPRGAQRFRLAGQIGTYWSDFKVDGIRESAFATPGSSRWRTIPLLAYRAMLEPEVLLAFGQSWETSAFANVRIGGGAAYPSNGGGDTSDAIYDLTSMVDVSYEVGFRSVFGPIFGQISFESRWLRGGDSSADSDEATGQTFPDVVAESATLQGVWLLVGVAF